ncbi:hypothetical protein FHT01_002501 [Sphingomonas japonica]|uniref:Peptidase inhibitor I78 family protein n=2 Tax=Sphingomonas japonica TaxID=511662 RepID=A0ABX0U311_9SPHN|nr:I78 family peptidase inhibitor [Sphingomonas japonica]NIJ24959.1 hypothetical protein [Sphingomonas japonica]
MLLLGACTAANQQTPSAPSDAEQAGAQCDAGAIQDLIGKPADAFADDAKARSGAAAVRRYVTGSPVTMDFRADRLNVETDPTGTIVKLSCG